MRGKSYIQMLNTNYFSKSCTQTCNFSRFLHPFQMACCSLGSVISIPTQRKEALPLKQKSDSFKGKCIPFCRWYITLGNATEAAIRAGCPPDTAEQDGLELLYSAYCRGYLKKLAAQPSLPLRSLVIAGLARLAFGSANDAAKLAYTEEISDGQLRALDLFHVTSIRHDRNGFEIKLADRQRAMEKLLECAADAESEKAAAALLTALQGEVNDFDADISVLPEAADGNELVEES